MERGYLLINLLKSLSIFSASGANQRRAIGTRLNMLKAFTTMPLRYPL